MLTPFAGGGEKITGSMPRLTSSSSVRRSSRAASFQEVSTVWPSLLTCQLALRYCATGDANPASLTKSFDVSQSRTFQLTALHPSAQLLGNGFRRGVPPHIDPKPVSFTHTHR